MAYIKTVYENDSAPAISAENLNKSEDELEYLDSTVNDVAGYYDSEQNITLNTGAIMVTSSTGTVASLTPDTSQTAYKYALVECQYRDKFVLTGQGGSVRLYAFIDSNNNILLAATANEVRSNYEITAPINTAYLIYNSKLGNMSSLKYYKYNNGLVSDLQDEINSLKIEENEVWN